MDFKIRGIAMKVTILTPTYNRAYTLERLFQSLKTQTLFDFEWLVIDDGSTDLTQKLFEKWNKERLPFDIIYYKKDNGGKCRAINFGLQYARGELFLVVDSDDYLSNDAIEKIVEWSRTIKEKEAYCGFSGNSSYGGKEEENPIFDKQYVDCTFLDRYPRKENDYFFIGHDRAWIFFTEVHKKYLYPVFPNEKFMTEAVVWNRMAKDGLKLRCFNDIIYFYDHQEDGLTNSIKRNFLSNPRGYGLWLSEKSKILKESYRQRLRIYYSFTNDLIDLDCKDIAEFINTSYLIIFMCRIVHNVVNLVKRVLG